MSSVTIKPVYGDDDLTSVILAVDGGTPVVLAGPSDDERDMEAAAILSIIDPSGCALAGVQFEPWDHTCGDGCCFDWGTKMTLPSGVAYEVGQAQAWDVARTLLEVAGHTVIIDDTEMPWSPTPLVAG